MTTKSTHSSAAIISARSFWLLTGRPEPFRLRTDSSPLIPTINASPRARGIQVANVTDVKKIETAIRRDNLFPGRAQSFRPLLELFQGDDFIGAHCVTTNFSARGKI